MEWKSIGLEESGKMKHEVLIIYEEQEPYKLLRQELEEITISTELATTLGEAIYTFIKKEFCLVIIYASVSERDGQKFLETIQNIKPVPILFLSSNTGYSDRLQALQSGVSAYLGKPYTLEECVAQIKSLLRLYEDLKLQRIKPGTLIHDDNLIIDPVKRTVVLKGKLVKLTRKEFDLLYLMASHPDQVFTREQLYRQIWNTDYPVSVDDSVKTHIKTLRKKLSGIDCIQNVWGVGYCFKPK